MYDNNNTTNNDDDNETLKVEATRPTESRLLCLHLKPQSG